MTEYNPPTETPDVAELRRLYSEWQETVNPYGFRLMPSGEYYALAAAVVNALPGLLDAAAERDALAAKVERVRALPAKHRAGGWYMTSMRDVLAALDEEPQP